MILVAASRAADLPIHNSILVSCGSALFDVDTLLPHFPLHIHHITLGLHQHKVGAICLLESCWNREASPLAVPELILLIGAPDQQIAAATPRACTRLGFQGQ